MIESNLTSQLAVNYQTEQIGQPEQPVLEKFAQVTATNGLRRFFQRRQITNATEHSTPPAEASFTSDTTAKGEVAVISQPETVAENFTLLDQLLSPAVLTERRAASAQVIDQDSELTAYGVVYNAKIANARTRNSPDISDDSERARQLDADYIELSRRDALFSRSVVGKYRVVTEAVRQIDAHESYDLAADSKTAAALIAMITGAAVGGNEQPTSAPFANFKNNTTDSWQAVSNDEIVHFLEEYTFTDRVAAEHGAVTINAPEAEPFEIPLSLITHAAGFDSWKGRHDATKSWNSAFGGGTMASLDVIKHYAGLPTELPPVSEVRVVIGRNGALVCDNGSGDSHRIAAAILRGDATIKANSLKFVRAEKKNHVTKSYTTKS